MTNTTALSGIKERAEGRTEGSWHHQSYGGQHPDGAHTLGSVYASNGEYVSWEVSDADGALIAAAPKLLAALEAVEKLADAWSVTPKRPTTFDAALHHAHIQIRTAITNAMR